MAGIIIPEKAPPLQSVAPVHCGVAVWFTGLSGSGKTTLCRTLELELRSCGYRVQTLDGDEVRKHLSPGLGFGKKDRDENIRRIAYVAQLLVRQQVIVLVAAISPYRAARGCAREDTGNFLEVYVNAPLETCIQRDPKQLYARALRGELSHFTGIDDVYEAPLKPDVECKTDQESCTESAAKIFTAIVSKLGKPGWKVESLSTR